MRNSNRGLVWAAAVAAALVTTAPAEAVRRRVFATSVTGTGNLGSWPDAGAATGIAAGDAICRARATAASLPNANTFRAWLSSASTDAYCHVQGLTGHRDPGCAGGPPQAAGPWFRFTFPTSLPYSEELDELTAPAGCHLPSRPLRRVRQSASTTRCRSTGPAPTRTARAIPTPTARVGSPPPSHMYGVTGSALGTAQLWTLGSGNTCNASLRLLCFEPGASEATGQRWSTPGSLVFMTSAMGNADLGSWSEAGAQTGLAAGDAICRTLAAEAHLPAPASFVAWLSSGAVDARDRLTSNGPYRRIDGVTVANSEADLLDGTNDNSIHQHEDGGYQIGQASGQVFTGTLADGTASSGTHCSNWTSGAQIDVTGGVGGTAFNSSWTDYSLTSCSYGLHLYCFSNAVTLFWDGFDLTGNASRWSSAVP